MDKQDWGKIENLFHRAKSLSVSERKSFLDHACADDEALRQEVMSLLENADKDGELDAVVQQTAYSMLNNEQEMIGQRIGPYQIVQILGRGGMGAVYLAERADDQYHQRVAIKLIRASEHNDEVMQRFRLERQILANLEHPYIARLLDGGATDTGMPYLVMEYVEGETIEQYCNRRRLSIPDRLRLFIKLCSAVQYAHQKLVVHRDLKPSNMLVTAEGEPRLLDFGIAKLLDETQDPNLLLQTRDEARRLTLRYSSPEQIRGEAVSTVTDVYALGIVLYELLSGKQPFGVKDTSAYDYQRQVLETQPEPPSTSVIKTDIEMSDDTQLTEDGRLAWCGSLYPRQLQRQLSGDLDNIVMMALRKEPERRYQSVAQLAEDIERYLRQMPIMARPTSWGYRSSRFLARHRFSSSLALLLLVSVISFTALTMMQSQQVVIERDQARVERARAQAISDFLTGMFSEIQPDKAQGQEVTVREVVDQATRELGSGQHTLSDQPEVEAEVRRVIGGIYSELGLLPPAESNLDRSLQLYRELEQTESEGYLLALNGMAGVYHQQFDQKQREKLMREALDLSRRLYGEDHQHTLGMLNALASIQHMNGKLDEAEQMFNAVYRRRAALLGERHQDTLSTLYSLGTVYHWQGRFDEAEKNYRLCQEKSKAALGEKHTQTLSCLGALGSVLETSGKYARARPVLEQHIELATQVVGDKHPETLRSMHNLADTLRGLGHFEASEVLFLKTLAIRREALGPENIETLQSQMKLARLYRLMQRYDDAEPLVKDTVNRQREQLGFEHPTTLIATQELAELYRVEQRQADAIALYQRVLAAREKVLGADHPELHNTLVGLGRVYLAEGRTSEAEPLFRRALQLADDNPDMKHQDLPDVLKFLIDLNQRDPARVQEYQQRLVELKN